VRVECEQLTCHVYVRCVVGVLAIGASIKTVHMLHLWSGRRQCLAVEWLSC
jgi:hypothetical protein